MSIIGFDATGITQKAIALEQDMTLLEARNTMIKYNISRIARFLYSEVPSSALTKLSSTK
jgi:mitochondrial fission protein ELM1